MASRQLYLMLSLYFVIVTGVVDTLPLRNDLNLSKDGVVHFHLRHHALQTHAFGSTGSKATLPHAVPLNQDLLGGIQFSIDIQVGTPPQMISVMPHTAASELWLNANCTDPDDYFPDECKAAGLYFANESSTSQDLGTVFQHLDLNKASVTGTYFEDNLTIGGYALKGQIFAVANATKGGWVLPVLGLSGGRGGNTNYSTVIDRLKDDDYIQDRDFSVSAGTSNAAAGSLVFGGVDLGKYSGVLQAIPLTPQVPNELWQYGVAVRSLGVTMPNTFTSAPLTSWDYNYGAVPFLGSATLVVPDDALKQLVCHFHEAKLDNWVGWYSVDCARQGEEGTFDITFDNGAVARIPFAELVVKLPPPDGGTLPNATVDFNTTCWLAVLNGSSPIQLGGPFFRSHTVLFQQDKETIYMATAANCSENIVSTHNIDSGMLFGDCSEFPAGQPLE